MRTHLKKERKRKDEKIYRKDLDVLMEAGTGRATPFLRTGWSVHYHPCPEVPGLCPAMHLVKLSLCCPFPESWKRKLSPVQLGKLRWPQAVFSLRNRNLGVV